jgi:hypothetical protein
LDGAIRDVSAIRAHDFQSMPVASPIAARTRRVRVISTSPFP